MQVAIYNTDVIFGYMTSNAAIVEQIQTLAAKILATHPAGHRLCLIGGFRYRLLNASCRSSVDIDYHWEGDLDRKQVEIVDVLRPVSCRKSSDSSPTTGTCDLPPDRRRNLP